MKNLLRLKDVSELSKQNQKAIVGGGPIKAICPPEPPVCPEEDPNCQELIDYIICVNR
ncbi:hypothetical protein LXD69_02700 [Flavobacterium sediminilitoris]|uniref:Bacteriocin-like protein n=1 Tax=Flavobacterium sediminilitoris TaxID=2024526 RepID=A0ABY4HQG3_9FLAO|nr:MULTISPECIES: hypothetical protein [Flavobacterium]UOX34432.1 hypothetical protein LXD69_02700 [Flavobacterium sediminilitoris]